MSAWRSTFGRSSILVVVASMALVGCTEGDEPKAAAPSYRETACPDDLQTQLVGPHSCGTLVAPEDRDHPDQGTVRLFVLRVQPPEGTPVAEEAMLVAGMDLAEPYDYVGVAPMAQRIGREVIMMDARGTGHSEPSLQCPEVEQLADELATATTTDSDGRRNFTDAVAACFQRIRDQGVDPADYDLVAMAADAEDLRRALGIERWGITTHGTSSRLALEIVRRTPEHVGALVLDTPSFPEIDPYTEAIVGTREAIHGLASACETQRACARAFPDLEVAIAEALETLRRDPVALNGSEGRSIVMDDVLFLRVLRQMLTRHDLPIELVPSFVYGALDGRLRDLETPIVDAIASDPSYCLGYHPKCLPGHELAEGTEYSILCSSVVPFVDRAALQAAANGEASYDDAFAASPYLELCDSWPVAASTSDVAEPVVSDVPTLGLIGGFDPYAATEEATEQAIGSFGRGWVVTFPNGGHNLLGDECPRAVRNAWLQRPTSAPTATDCIDREPPLRFVIPEPDRS